MYFFQFKKITAVRCCYAKILSTSSNAMSGVNFCSNNLINIYVLRHETQKLSLSFTMLNWNLAHFIDKNKLLRYYESGLWYITFCDRWKKKTSSFYLKSSLEWSMMKYLYENVYDCYIFEASTLWGRDFSFSFHKLIGNSLSNQ